MLTYALFRVVHDGARWNVQLNGMHLGSHESEQGALHAAHRQANDAWLDGHIAQVAVENEDPYCPARSVYVFDQAYSLEPNYRCEMFN